MRLIFLGPEFESSHLLHILHPGSGTQHVLYYLCRQQLAGRGAALSGTRLPTGNCHHTFFVDLITQYDAKDKTCDERQAIVDLTNLVVDQAREVDGLEVDFSGTHLQPDDVDRSASSSVIFGTEAMAETVKALKKRTDPNNRLRFHPFAKFL